MMWWELGLVWVMATLVVGVVLALGVWYLRRNKEGRGWQSKRR